MLRLFLTAVIVLLWAPGANAQAPKQGVSCSRGLVEMPGEGRAGKFVLCSEVEQLVPQLKQQLDQLTAGKATTDGRLQDLEKLLRNVNAIGGRLEKRQLELAQSLTRVLSQATEQSDMGAARQIRRLSDDIEELNEKVARTAANTRTVDAAAALKPAIEDAIAALDLSKANKLLDSIAALQEQLSGVERKVDIVVVNTDESRNVAVFSEALRGKSRGDMGQARVLGSFVQQGRTFDGQDFSGVGFARAQAPGMAAPGADLTLAAFPNADLKGADFSGARMIATIFEGANLQQAKLQKARAALVQGQGANLQGADLSRSNWFGADLRGADLRQANLKGANLAHADMRGANLSGADLSGAFLRNADLRGAKFDGTKFLNTDVASALLPGEQLTPQQFSALCATSKPTNSIEKWQVIERIPTSRFSGGYENRTIFDESVYIGDGGHRPYPLCQLRAEDSFTDWNEPIYSHNGVEFLANSFDFGVEHPLMQAVGRRAELLGRMSAARTAAMKRPEDLPTMHQQAQLLKRLYTTLEERQKQLTARLTPPARPLELGFDTALLIALRIRPSVINDVGISWKDASQGGFWGYQGQVPDDASPWPRLFPEGFMRDDVSEVTAQSWERWSRARSRVLRRNEAALQVSRDILLDNSDWGSVVIHQSRQGSADAQLASRLGIDPARLITYPQTGSLEGARRVVSTSFIMEGDIAVAREALKASNSRPEGNLLLPVLVKDVRFVKGDQPHADHLVWTMELLPK